METIQVFSIFIELMIAVLAVLMWIRKKRFTGALIFLTFTIYIFYDIARLWSLDVPESLLRIAFAVAAISMLVAVWRLYNQK